MIEATLAALGVVTTQHVSPSLQESSYFCFCPPGTQALYKPPTLSLVSIAMGHWVYRKAQTECSSKESRKQTDYGHDRFAILHNSTGIPNCQAQVLKNAFPDLWTSLVPPGMWSFWLSNRPPCQLYGLPGFLAPFIHHSNMHFLSGTPFCALPSSCPPGAHCLIVAMMVVPVVGGRWHKPKTGNYRIASSMLW